MWDIVIIGAGAAGCMAASVVRQRAPWAKVLVLEKTDKLLAKVKISGGGRCNLTHQSPTVRALLQAYPRGAAALKQVFRQFDHQATQVFFQDLGVVLKTENDGRVFPVTDRSQTVMDALLRAMQGVELLTKHPVSGIFPHESGGFDVHTPGNIFRARQVIVATGGATKKEQLAFLQPCAVSLTALYPSLFTLTTTAADFHALSGLAVQARLKLLGQPLQQEGAVLLTHFGLSGPAVLAFSAFGAVLLAQQNYRFSLAINFTPALSLPVLTQALTNASRKQIGGQALFGLPIRLWQLLLTRAGIATDMRWCDLGQKQRNKLIEQLTNTVLEVVGKTTFKEEFVTAGGVDWAQIDPHTMRSLSGLYFAGEVLDADGITGGYNFQNAWSTAYVAAVHAVQALGNVAQDQ